MSELGTHYSTRPRACFWRGGLLRLDYRYYECPVYASIFQLLLDMSAKAGYNHSNTH